MSEPLRIVAIRWTCPYCNRARATKSATVAHIGRCWSNPDVRAWVAG